jgi:hypothetical protein
MTWPLPACRGFLGALFLLAAAGKLERPKTFLGTVLDFRILPDTLARLTAVTMPGVELAVGLVLAFAVLAPPGARGGWRDAVAAAEWLALLLTVAFTLVIAQALLRGISMECGCFDILAQHVPALGASRISWWTVLRDVAFVLPAAWLVHRQR